MRIYVKMPSTPKNQVYCSHTEFVNFREFESQEEERNRANYFSKTKHTKQNISKKAWLEAFRKIKN